MNKSPRNKIDMECFKTMDLSLSPESKRAAAAASRYQISPLDLMDNSTLPPIRPHNFSTIKHLA